MIPLAIDWDTVFEDVAAAAVGLLGGIALFGVLQYGGGWVISQIWPGVEYPGVAALFLFLFGLTGLSVMLAGVVTLYERWIVEEGETQ